MRDRNVLARLVDSGPFTVVVTATIALDAAVLGLQTTKGSSSAEARRSMP